MPSGFAKVVLENAIQIVSPRGFILNALPVLMLTPGFFFVSFNRGFTLKMELERFYEKYDFHFHSGFSIKNGAPTFFRNPFF